MSEPQRSLTVCQADARDALFARPVGSVATVFADPPYNTGNRTNKTPTYTRSAEMAAKKWTNFHAEWDAQWQNWQAYDDWTVSWLEGARHALHPEGSIWVCGTHHNLPAVITGLRALGGHVINLVAWYKRNAMPHLAGKQLTSSCEMLVWARFGKRHQFRYDRSCGYAPNGKNLRDMWDIPNDSVVGRRFKHPSKKPVKLVVRALDIVTPDGGTVVDPFCGSGTTGAAWEQLPHLGACYLSDRDVASVEMTAARLGVGISGVVVVNEGA